MSSKKSFILRLDPEDFKVLEKWAADEFRSVNGQIEYLLHNAITNAGRKGSANTAASKKTAPKKNKS